MKKDQVRVGEVYSADVSGSVVPVRITQERWTDDRHTGWVGTNLETGRSVVVKSAERVRARVVVVAAAPKTRKAAPPVAAPAAHGGAGGVAARAGVVTAKAASPVPPAAASGGTGKKGGKRGKATGGRKAARAGKPKGERPMSGLDAAAKVLADARQPMHVGEVMAVIVKKGLWSSRGLTPAATLYAAMIREIAAKGPGSRFKKVERGVFAANV